MSIGKYKILSVIILQRQFVNCHFHQNFAACVRYFKGLVTDL